jgi:hypothetical protein
MESFIFNQYSSSHLLFKQCSLPYIVEERSNFFFNILYIDRKSIGVIHAVTTNIAAIIT